MSNNGNYHMVMLISHASQFVLQILQAGFQQHVNLEFPDVQAGFWRGRGTRGQIANICWIMEKVREFQKNTNFCFTDYAKAFDQRLATNCGQFLKTWEYRNTLPVS